VPAADVVSLLVMCVLVAAALSLQQRLSLAVVERLAVSSQALALASSSSLPSGYAVLVT